MEAKKKPTCKYNVLNIIVEWTKLLIGIVIILMGLCLLVFMSTLTISEYGVWVGGGIIVTGVLLGVGTIYSSMCRF